MIVTVTLLETTENLSYIKSYHCSCGRKITSVTLPVMFAGDVSTPVGKPVPDENCHPLGVEVFQATHRSVKQP
jgi:hypothetical protein